MRNRIAVAALGAVAAAGAATAVSWSTAPESTGAAVTLTGAETTDPPDLQTSMAEADKDIANLADQDIWGRTVFAYPGSAPASAGPPGTCHQYAVSTSVVPYIR